MVRRLIKHSKRLVSRKPKKLNYKEEKLLLMREQTILSKERTVLSFMRTGLATVGAGIVIINLFPSIESQIVSWAFILSGIVQIAESYRRLRSYQKKMNAINDKLGDDGA